MAMDDNRIAKGLIVLILVIFLVGCEPQSTPIPTGTTRPLVVNTTTETPTHLPSITSTKSLEPTSTNTATIDPTLLWWETPQGTLDLESTPTQLPTFEMPPTSDFTHVRQIRLTSTPPAKCPPPSKTKLSLPDPLPNDAAEFQQSILDILNQGGIDKFWAHYSTTFDKNDIAYEDLTNDGIKELVITSPGYAYHPGYLQVIGCQDGAFVNLFSQPGDVYSPHILAIKDVNNDGMNELVIRETTCEYCEGMWVYEWDGHVFQSLVRSRWYRDVGNPELKYFDVAELDGYSSSSIKDIDHNGTYELILEGGIPSWMGATFGGEGPYRTETDIYMWDGKYYTPYSQKYSPPNFRFEAVQDGDDETMKGEYDTALASYQAAIFNDQLKSWNEEVWQQLLGWEYPDIRKMPFNQTEYDQLSSYGRYRIMLNHLKLGRDKDAATVYQTLQTKYPPDNAGYPYVEMAAQFWNEYQSSHDLVLACSKAIQYANDHPEILKPLGPHGTFDKSYLPSSVCPFQNQP